MRRHVFVCTTGYSDHWSKNVEEHRAKAATVTPEEIEARRKEAQEHSNGHVGLHCGEKLGGDLYQEFRAGLDARGITDIQLSPNACAAQHKEGSMVMVYPDGVWYHLNDIAEVQEIIDQHLVGDQPVERLVFRRVAQPQGKGVAAAV